MVVGHDCDRDHDHDHDELVKEGFLCVCVRFVIGFEAGALEESGEEEIPELVV